MPTLKGARTSPGVRVKQFQADAAGDAMSVQIWYCAWRNADRVLRFVGPCTLCGRLVWSADDGENDPRGVMGEHTNQPLVAAEHQMEGPDVVLCVPCAGKGASYQRALTYAMTRWTVPSTTP